MFTNLRELILSMPTEETCREYLAQQRWHGKPVCPYCGCTRIYNIEKNKRYKCGNSECYKKFSVTVGTVMEASNIPLLKWFTAIYLISAHKKGISSHQLRKDIGVSQKCSWFMLHRIREAMRVKGSVKLDNIVEADECWIGGRVKYMRKSKRAKLRTGAGGTIQNKVMVVGMIERGGNLKLVACGKETGPGIVQPILAENIEKDAVIITDYSHNYSGLVNQFAGHEMINHNNDEFCRDGVIHTNTIEGAFGMLKRSILGIYHAVSSKHLSRYCSETMYRYNLRKMKDPERFTLTLQNVEGRLKYKDLVKKSASELTPQIIEIPERQIIAHKKHGRPVYQMRNGKVVAYFKSMTEASNNTGIKHVAICRCAKGERKTAGGYEWKYA